MRLVLTAVLALLTGAALVACLLQPVTTVATATTPSSSASEVAPATPDQPLPMDTRWPDSAPSPEQVMYDQPRLMRRALASLTPRIPGGPNLYLVAFAGDGGEDVFRNEADYAARLFQGRYGNRAHTLVLENNPATLSTQPLASWSNLETALTGVAAAMDPQQDILLLYLTSHGSPDHTLLVDMDPLPLDQIGASDLAGILAEHPFKWKVVVVNACYSGGFIPPLRGDGTLVLTAARTDRSSFGCGSDSDITYFGRAWLVDALNHSADPVTAFNLAKREIADWEATDSLTPSQPQMAVGEGIEQQLTRWQQGIKPGAAVPFGPDARRSKQAAHP